MKRTKYLFPQLAEINYHEVGLPEEAEQYLPKGTPTGVFYDLYPDPDTGLPLFVPDRPECVKKFKDFLDTDITMEELKEMSYEEKVENITDFLFSIKDAFC